MKTRFLVIAISSAIGLAAVLPVSANAADRGRAVQSIGRAGDHNQGTRDRRPIRQPNEGRRGNRNRNNVVAGNSIVVNHNTDRGYHHHGYDHDRHDRWDDDDDGFFDVMGRAVAVTAGVGVTTAVIGEIFDDEPDGCEQVVSRGQTYLLCNGVWYQPVMAGSDVQYTVVAEPR